MDGASSPPERPIGAWNVVVTAQEGCGRPLKRALRDVVRLEWTPFKNVALGWVPDRDAFLGALDVLWTAEPRLAAWLGKAIPVDATLIVDERRLLDQLDQVVAPWLPRLAGGSFYVRVVRRGHKGVIDSHATERELGARIVARAEAEGRPVTVSFTDPDFVVDVELVGDVAGVALLSRAERTCHPFLRVD
ncbi:MAG TPA: THUMP domain-containing protein [Candidatus Limnocylindria bacterium]|nr:THUMP domain-containing protein [Candidatus Limnocylindria bacterium]